MTRNCAGSVASVRMTFPIAERLARIALTDGVWPGNSLAPGHAGLSPVDNVVDRLDRICEHRSRDDAQ